MTIIHIFVLLNHYHFRNLTDRMRKILLTLSIFSMIGVACTEDIKQVAPTQEGNNIETKLVGNPFGEKEEGTILARLSDSAAAAIERKSLEADQLLDGLDDASIVPVFANASSPAAIRHGLHKWYVVSFDSSISPETAAEILAKRPEIEAVEYNSILNHIHATESFEYTESFQSKGTASADLPFNDLLLKDQWGLINNGTIDGAVAGADTGVKDAWRLTAGDPRIVVAVFDQGIAIDHSDLKNALWVNEAEKNGVAGKDDDNNGYVDDIHGYNFAENKGRPSYMYNADHGTHVAGTIGATNNNGLGVSSIAGGTGIGDGVRLMSCQIFSTTGVQASSKKVADAFYYAANHGASIAQCSYGYQDMDGMSKDEIMAWMNESVEYHALQYFLDPENANCEAVETNIAIFSAGNYNTPMSLYPGALDECISVTAICHDFLPGGYSNYGAGCDIAAPGGDIIEKNTKAPCMILSTGINNNGAASYIYKYGTSMACPHVSGVVALGMSYAMKIGKKFTREEFVSRLLTSTHNIDGYITAGQQKLMVNGYDYVPVDVFVKKNKMGTGTVDAWKFLMSLEGTQSLLTSPGQKLTIDVNRTIGAGYSLEINSEDAAALGIEGTPAVKDGILEITCTKIGSGKIRFKASVGRDDAGVIPELDYYKNISIVSRPAVAANGGWL